MKKISFNNWCATLAEKGIKISALRKEVLSILFHQAKPIGAYDLLERLKKKRSNAKPPTVYRVLKWLIDVNLVHRIESENAYVFCSAFHDHGESHSLILFVCSTCHAILEMNDASVFRAILQFTKKNRMKWDDHPVEVRGVCEQCLG